MMQYRATWRIAFLATGLALALSACGGENDARHVTDWERSHKINISSHFVTTPIQVAPNGTELAPAEAAKLAAAVSDFAQVGGGVFEIAVPKGSGGDDQAAARAELVRHYALRYGVIPRELQIRYTAIAGDGPVVVSYERFVATPPHCGPTVDNQAYDPNNVLQDTYGCVTQHNLANMISNPADLARMRQEAPADNIRRSKVVPNYRDGNATASDEAARAGSAASF